MFVKIRESGIETNETSGIKSLNLENTPPNRQAGAGFTIVELLIVIVVIGILAAISIVAYNGIQNRANNTAIQNDLNQMKKVAELYKAEEGVYPSPTEFFSRVKVSKSSYYTTHYNLYYCTDNPAKDGFGIAARSTSSQTYTVSSNYGIKTTDSIPTLNSACGALGQDFFGETWADPWLKPNNTNVLFSLGFHKDDGWRGNL